jgi:two-component system phosphate regulon sensor histidine kinase PhoR
VVFKTLPDSTVFSVTDDGVGIDPRHIPRLTERFYRADASRSSNTGGAGLGLAIVKHALKPYGGQLHIESKPGHGSTFTCNMEVSRAGYNNDKHSGAR